MTVGFSEFPKGGGRFREKKKEGGQEGSRHRFRQLRQESVKTLQGIFAVAGLKRYARNWKEGGGGPRKEALEEGARVRFMC